MGDSLEAEESAVDLLDCYQLQSGRVVRVVGRTRERLTLEAFETGERFPVERGPFEADVRSGHVDRVYARWELTPPEDAKEG